MCDTVMSAEKTRENVTCEGVLFTPSVGCSRLLSAENDLTTTFFFLKKKSCQNFSRSSLMRKRLQQVALFFDAAHSTSSEVIDFH